MKKTATNLLLAVTAVLVCALSIATVASAQAFNTGLGDGALTGNSGDYNTALGYDTLHVYDTRAPLANRTPRVDFEQPWVRKL